MQENMIIKNDGNMIWKMRKILSMMWVEGSGGETENKKMKKIGMLQICICEILDQKAESRQAACAKN